MVASTAGAAAVLGSESSVDAQTLIDVNSRLADRTPGDGYFDVFGPYTFGANGASFVFQHAFETGSGEGLLTLIANGNVSFAGTQIGPYFYVSNVPYGQFLSTLNFGINNGNRGDMAWAHGYSNSQFLNPGTAFLGFRFDLGLGTQYGWAEVDLEGAPQNTGVFVRYGWDEPGVLVCAGYFPHWGGGCDLAIPETSCLSVLATGSVGLMMWRRRRYTA